MGGSGFLSSGNESEEEEKKEAPKKKTAPKVFRPNLTAGNRFTEDLRGASSAPLDVDDIV